MLKPFEWQDRPSLIEHLFPVQKISAESFKEQMAGAGKTLTALGSYWKGRKPLILNKACILGALLPTSDNSLKDLEIFELLMGMDNASMAIRHGRIKPNQIVARVQDVRIKDWFEVIPETAVLPERSPFMIQDFPCVVKVKGIEREIIPSLIWQAHISNEEQLSLEARALPFKTYQENVSRAKRPEELADKLYDHVWKKVNGHLGTSAFTFPELVEQIGIARFGHRPRVGDVFCGSGQIPFEAARLGCDVYASDLRMNKKPKGSKFIYQFRSVTANDLAREQKVIDYVGTHLSEWQEKGYVPDMVIEKGDETERLYRERGWTHWHHLWGSRQLLYLAMIRQNIDTPEIFVLFSGLLDQTSKLCRWTTSAKGNSKIGGGKRTGGASDNPTNVFYNQALNTFLNYGTRSLLQLFDVINKKVNHNIITNLISPII